MARKSKKRPEALAQTPEVLQRGLLVGWRDVDAPKPRFGFEVNNAPPTIGAFEPVLHEAEGHIITIAPTGAGKGRGAIIPNLLTYPGSAIVIDPKGEAAAVTARRRREMGQDVFIVDPFRVVTQKPDSLNPFDVFDMADTEIDIEAETLATLLSGEVGVSKDAFWDLQGRALVSGVIAYVAQCETPQNRHFGRVRDILKGDDPVHFMAMTLDNVKNLNRLSHQTFAAFCTTTDVTRSGILSTAQSYTTVLGSDAATRTLGPSTIDLQALRRGEAMTIFLVVPPSRLGSHGAMFRLWVAALMFAVMSRNSMVDRRTLFIIDECAQLGRFDLLLRAMTLLRSYSLQVWAFLQDLSQLKQLYPQDWPTVVNNAGVLQIFGVRNHMMARELADMIGDIDAQGLRMLPPDKLVALKSGSEAEILKRPDYLTDPAFEGTFDPNPLFRRASEGAARDV